jgi:tetratricopeptide (TPR) repeat protein
MLLVLLAVGWSVGIRAAMAWHQRSHGTARSRDRAEDDEERGALAAMIRPLTPPQARVRPEDVFSLNAGTVIALLRAGRTEELREALEAAQNEFERDTRNEPLLDGLFEGLSLAGPAELPALDAWVAASPRSFTGYAARGAERIASIRGEKSLACDPNGRRRLSDRERENLSLARSDLERAAELRPGLVVAYTLSMRTFIEEGHAAPSELLERAVAVCAACRSPREEYMLGLRPAWGGSREAMEAFVRGVRQAPGHALSGYTFWDECLRLQRESDLEAARDACDGALSSGGREPRFLRAKAGVLFSMKRYAEAADTYGEALSKDPFDVDALVERARARGNLEEWEKTAPDLRLALQLAPDNESALDLLSWVNRRWKWNAERALRQEDFSEALEVYDAAARAFPEYSRYGELRHVLAVRLGPLGGATP